MVSDCNPRELLDLAVSAAQEAGHLLMEGHRLGRVEVVSTKSSWTDVVTEMDRASEALIVERIRTARPEDGFVNEEAGAMAGLSGVRWIVDPIDGTVNYLYRYPMWAVSIAAEVKGHIVAGVVEVAPLGETYTAVIGGGAFRGLPGMGTQLHVNDRSTLDLALIATGFGYTVERRRNQASALQSILPRIRDIRRGGSSALDLCSVASGRVDAYFEQGLQYWDVAAGALIAREAGARVEGLYESSPAHEYILAASPKLFDELRELILPLDSTRYQ